MKKIALVALLSAFVAAPAVAADLPVYAGVSLGSSTIGSTSATATGFIVGYKLDKSRTPFMGKGSLAVEGHYTMLGSIDSSYSIGTNTLSATDKYSSIGVDAIATYPIPSVEKLSAFAKLGFASTSAARTCSGTGFFAGKPCAATGSASGLVYGAGAQYDVTTKIGVRAGYQTYASDASALYVAGVYSF